MFRRLLKENIKAFHPKSQVWKARLRSSTEPSKVGNTMNSAHSIQVNDPTKNVLEVIQEENEHNKEIFIHAEAAFQIDL